METELNFAQQLVNNSKPGDVEYITVSGTNSRLFTRFNPPLVFDPAANSGYEIALCRLETYYSFPNIDSSNNELCVSIDNGKKWLHLLIPSGVYDIDAVNNVLQELLSSRETNDRKKKEKYFMLRGNQNTLKCELEIMSSTTIVDFNVKNNIRSVLGFEAKKYVGGKKYESKNKINTVRVQSILVHCDIIKPSRVNGTPAPVIYNFSPNVSQDLDLLGQRLTLSFHIRKRR